MKAASVVPPKPERGCTGGIWDSLLESRENWHRVVKWDSHSETVPPV